MRLVEDQISELTCLVVDDEARWRDDITAYLTAIGTKQVITAASGSEAFNMLKAAAQPVDVILSDIRMPSGNGLKLLQVLRSGYIRSMRPNATFVLFTASPMARLVKAASLLDANGFMVKPLDRDKLEEALLKARRSIFPPNATRHVEVAVPEEIP